VATGVGVAGAVDAVVVLFGSSDAGVAFLSADAVA
jgi:hypothetical protein